MKPLLALLGTLGLASAATATTLAVRGTLAGSVASQETLRPGPDSGRVATFLSTLAQADPVFCEMVSDQIGNFWWSDGDLAVGRLRDARGGARAAKDSIAAPVRDAGAIQLLSATLDDADPCVRQVAAKMLGNSGAPDEVIGGRLAVESARVREAALRAAGERDRPALRARVERLLDAPEPAVAAMAAWVLGEYEQKASLVPLRRALAHADAAVRTAAAWGLGQLEDEAVASDLERLVAGDVDRRVRLAAIAALGQLDGLAQAPEALLRATESPDRVLRYAALEALLEFEDDRVVPVLLDFITDPDPEVRVQVIEALGERQAESAVRAITRALTDVNAEVRRAAIEALAEIDDR